MNDVTVGRDGGRLERASAHSDPRGSTPPRTIERAATEVLQGLRLAEEAAEHLALGAEILTILELGPERVLAYEDLSRDLIRFATILRVRASSLREALPRSA